jgi:pseudaminic acid synthase
VSSPYIVAELSANHLGSLERAIELVGAAAWAGADAVKLQTFTPETMALPGKVITSGPWQSRYLQELYRETMTPREWHRPIFDKASALGIECFSSVFSLEDLRFLEEIGCPRYKIASFEIGDLQLIQEVAATGKPLIISTGMATLDEILQAVEAARKIRYRWDLTVLACDSAYPARPNPQILWRMLELQREHHLWSGISDHTAGIGLSVLAAAYGAHMIERHLTLDRQAGGADAAFSIEPGELEQMVRACKEVAPVLWGAAGPVNPVLWGPSPAELPQLALRRSLWVVKDIAKGEALTMDNVRALRPANGLCPALWSAVENKPARRAMKAGEPLEWLSIFEPECGQEA